MRRVIVIACLVACGIGRVHAQGPDDAPLPSEPSLEATPHAPNGPTSGALGAAPAPTVAEPGASVISAAPAAELAADAPDTEPPWTFSAGLDIYSRFIWRGVSFGDQWTIQPNASFTSHGFGLHAWASAAPNQASLVDYVGLTASYAYAGRWGTVGADLADWIFSEHRFPDGTVDTAAPYAFDFRGHGNGSHWLDLTTYYVGPSAFPIKVQLGALVFNDPDHSLYVGLSYPVDVGRGFSLTAEFGMVLGRSRLWYGTDDDPMNPTNCTVTLARTVAVGHGITLPLSAALIVNPESERVHFVVGAGVRY